MFEWTGLAIAFFTALGAFINSVLSARRADAEARKIIVETKKLQGQQNELNTGQKKVLHQFEPNGGDTLRDLSDKIEALLRENREDIRAIRAELSLLKEVDYEDRQRAIGDHKLLYDAIQKIEDDLGVHLADVPDILKDAQEDTLKIIEEKNDTSER